MKKCCSCCKHWVYGEPYGACEKAKWFCLSTFGERCKEWEIRDEIQD